MHSKTRHSRDVSSPLIYRFNANLINVPAWFLTVIDKLIQKFMWKLICLRIAKIKKREIEVERTHGRGQQCGDCGG